MIMIVMFTSRDDHSSVKSKLDFPLSTDKNHRLSSSSSSSPSPSQPPSPSSS